MHVFPADIAAVRAVCILLGFMASASLLARHWEAVENWSAEEPAQALADLEEPLYPQTQHGDNAAEVNLTNAIGDFGIANSFNPTVGVLALKLLPCSAMEEHSRGSWAC